MYYKIKVRLTAVSVGLRAIAVLETVCPRALVPRRGRGRLSNTVATLESLCPLPTINPPSTGFHPQAMPLPVLPLALVS